MDENAIRGALVLFGLDDTPDSVQLQNGLVRVTLVLGRAIAKKPKPLRNNIKKKLLKLSGVTRVLVIFTGHRTALLKTQAPLLPDVKSIIALASGKGTSANPQRR